MTKLRRIYWYKSCKQHGFKIKSASSFHNCTHFYLFIFFTDLRHIATDLQWFNSLQTTATHPDPKSACSPWWQRWLRTTRLCTQQEQHDCSFAEDKRREICPYGLLLLPTRSCMYMVINKQWNIHGFYEPFLLAVGMVQSEYICFRNKVRKLIIRVYVNVLQLVKRYFLLTESHCFSEKRYLAWRITSHRVILQRISLASFLCSGLRTSV